MSTNAKSQFIRAMKGMAWVMYIGKSARIYCEEYKNMSSELEIVCSLLKTDMSLIYKYISGIHLPKTINLEKAEQFAPNPTTVLKTGPEGVQLWECLESEEDLFNLYYVFTNKLNWHKEVLKKQEFNHNKYFIHKQSPINDTCSSIDLWHISHALNIEPPKLSHWEEILVHILRFRIEQKCYKSSYIKMKVDDLLIKPIHDDYGFFDCWTNLEEVLIKHRSHLLEYGLDVPDFAYALLLVNALEGNHIPSVNKLRKSKTYSEYKNLLNEYYGD